MNKSAIVAACILLVQLFAAGCGPADTDTRVIRLAHGLDGTHPVHKMSLNITVKINFISSKLFKCKIARCK